MYMKDNNVVQKRCRDSKPYEELVAKGLEDTSGELSESARSGRREDLGDGFVWEGGFSDLDLLDRFKYAWNKSGLRWSECLHPRNSASTALLDDLGGRRNYPVGGLFSGVGVATSQARHTHPATCGSGSEAQPGDVGARALTTALRLCSNTRRWRVAPVYSEGCALDTLVADGTAHGGGATGRRIRDGWLGQFGPHQLDGLMGFGGVVAAGRLGPGHGAGFARMAGMDRVALLGCGSGTGPYTSARGCMSWWVFRLAATGGADVWHGWRTDIPDVQRIRMVDLECTMDRDARWWISGWLDLGWRTWTRWDGADLRIMREGVYHDGAPAASTSTDSQSEFANIAISLVTLVNKLVAVTGRRGTAFGSLPVAPLVPCTSTFLLLLASSPLHCLLPLSLTLSPPPLPAGYRFRQQNRIFFRGNIGIRDGRGIPEDGQRGGTDMAAGGSTCSPSTCGPGRSQLHRTHMVQGEAGRRCPRTMNREAGLGTEMDCLSDGQRPARNGVVGVHMAFSKGRVGKEHQWELQGTLNKVLSMVARGRQGLLREGEC
ncbi:hypothetical protein GGX14DRAFT_402875 [Mycena pura]|uniref:Uncharacterized protein n=1 Tax=Mycena pura TaxID=153505 RepID=A0AAD6UXS0_9AGAR|nr:hypothetical protein GGX14DRAFT_402875 [Mycena pura]